MQVKDVMNMDPVCCTPETKVSDLAKMMVDCHCGSLPVVEDLQSKGPMIGVVTDRDIVCRLIAKDENPMKKYVKDCMTPSVVAVKSEDSIETCLDTMERYQIRRVPVVDDDGGCVGIVTQAHIAKKLPEHKAGELLKTLSQSSEKASRVPVHA
jgi:CBS domain-containing protein